MSELTIVKAQRHLKVGSYRRRHEDRNTKIPKGYSLHAALSLKGNWLEEAGFKANSLVQISVEQGKLVIELIGSEAA
jgi:toxic protein SymE